MSERYMAGMRMKRNGLIFWGRGGFGFLENSRAENRCACLSVVLRLSGIYISKFLGLVQTRQV
jgi:hypothetical protein